METFHPAVAAWFRKRFEAPTEPQLSAWPAIQSGRHTLIAAPTGSGKTLAAFLAAIDSLVREGLDRTARGEAQALPDETSVVYISPLKALSNDIQKNLREPLDGIAAELAIRRLPAVPIRVMVRTGDTPASERTTMAKRPPHILVTTPESFYILLTSESGRRMLRTARTVIVDEIHAVVQDKRGSHLALSLARLDALTGDRPLVRIGLSATQRPIEEVARFLVGSGRAVTAATAATSATSATGTAGPPGCTIVDSGHARRLDLAIEMPGSPLSAVMSNEVWEDVHARLAALIAQHRTTLVFVNTRRLTERITSRLAERLGAGNVASHHGSLSREARLLAEERLKSGSLSALVATASLELGIDIGEVDLVCQIGTTRSISSFLQRVGRSGHTVGGCPKGRLFPLTRDELVESVALLHSVRRGELDRLVIPKEPLDILAQQIVAEVAAGPEEGCAEDDLFALARGAWPFRDLTRDAFDSTVRMLAEGFTTRMGRRGAYLHHDRVNGRLRARRGARLAAITSGGAIPDNADYDVLLEPSGIRVGSVHEDFAVESMPGDIFQLGNTSWQILRVEPGKVRVEDARGKPPTLPFWLGEAPARSRELSSAVSRIREEVGSRVGIDAIIASAAIDWLSRETGVTGPAAEELVEYLAASKAALGVVPSDRMLVLERFFDESGGMQLVIHSPRGARLNRALGLALRKRFCRQFNFELQAAANEDAVVLSLGVTHSFSLGEVAGYLNPRSVRDVLSQALLAAPMFGARWRWNATRSLALLRFRGGKKVPAPLVRMNAEDLLALVFPDQLACAENLAGEREIPDHPLVNQTMRDCLEEAMDIDGLVALLEGIESGQIEVIARDLTEPSPLASEILNARPYAFLDDAPLEERRTQAVIQRRWLDPKSAADLGRLDIAAIERVRQEAWPEARNADELHDALVTLGFLHSAEGEAMGGRSLFDLLARDGRACEIVMTDPASGATGTLWVATERLPEFEAARTGDGDWTEILRGRIEVVGPVTAVALARTAVIPLCAVQQVLASLEVEGFILRGQFTPAAMRASRSGEPGESGEPGKSEESPGSEEPAGEAAGEVCSRRLLARIHRYTLDRLRREIEPVAPTDFIRFLISWQGVGPEGDGLKGTERLSQVLRQLEGFEAPAAAWEEEILPSRMAHYDRFALDAICLSGQFVWMRLSSPPSVTGPASEARDGAEEAGATVSQRPIRTTPIVLLERENLEAWRSLRGPGQGRGESSLPSTQASLLSAQAPSLSAEARVVSDALLARGACFFREIASSTGLLNTQVEAALAELVAKGLVASDSFAGLRALLVPSSRRGQGGGSDGGRSARGVRSRLGGMETAGRWALLWEPQVPALPAGTAAATQAGTPRLVRGGPADGAEILVRALLRRYGVLFRRLLDREGGRTGSGYSWREILRVCRTLEARGEIRGGRFVEGFAGEQFALPEAVGALRAARRRRSQKDTPQSSTNSSPGSSSEIGRADEAVAPLPPADGFISLSAADPLNLIGIVTPGARLASAVSNRLLYRDGEAIGILEAGTVRWNGSPMDAAREWQARNLLLRGPQPSRTRGGIIPA